MKKSISVLFLGVLLTSFVFAARVDRREHRQHARIAQGVRSGEITRGEAAKLRSEERHIRRAERRMRSDGNLSPNEKARLEHMQDKVSKDIYEQKHDEQKR